MRHLWSPWRLEYLTGPKVDGCIFCHAAGSSADRDNLVLLRDDFAFLILNRFPYNNGHFMVVPYAHVSSLEDLDAPTLTSMMLLLNRGLAALRSSMHPEGFNVGANLGHCAGAGVADHVHIHAVPRWSGDTNFHAGRRRHAGRAGHLAPNLRPAQGRPRRPGRSRGTR